MERQHVDAYQWSQERFAGADPGDMGISQGAKVTVGESGTLLVLSYLGRQVSVVHPDGVLGECDIDPAVNYNEHVLFLQYLAGMGALPPREPWVSFVELPGGPHHHDLFCEGAIDPLAEMYVRDRDEFCRAAVRWSGKPVNIADAAFVFTVFPKLEMLVTIHQGSDEFGARGTMLFDHNAIEHLPTASLFVLGLELSRRIRGVRT